MTFQEVVEITRPPTWTTSAWLLERKYPEQYSLKHVEVTANTEPPPVMQLVIVDPVKQREDAEADAPLTRLQAHQDPMNLAEAGQSLLRRSKRLEDCRE